MTDKLPICLPYYLKYRNNYELDESSKNVLEIIKYGQYHLSTQSKDLKNTTSIIKDLRLQKQPNLLKQLQKKYISLQSKKNQTLSWKNQSSIKIPKSIRVESILPPSIKVAGKPNKIKNLKTKRKNVKKNLSYRVKSLPIEKVNKKQPRKKKSKDKAKVAAKKTRKRKQSGGAEAPSVVPRKLFVEPTEVPTSPNLIGSQMYDGGKKKTDRILFRLDFQLPNGQIQKLFFKVALAHRGISGEFNMPRCVNYLEGNSYMYESNMYHTMNVKTYRTSLHQTILNIFGFGYTSKTNPVFSVKYDSEKNTIVGTETPEGSNITQINLKIPENILAALTTVFESLDSQDDYFSSTHISYNITEFTDNYIPLRYSKKVKTEEQVVKIILGAAGILATLYENYGFVHGDLHDLNYLVKDKELPEGDLPLSFFKFYDFDLSMLVNHPGIEKRNLVTEEWIGNVTHIYSEIYHKLLSQDLSLFGNLLSIFDFYRVFCNCGLTHPDGSTIFDFTGMTLFKTVYLEELSDNQYTVKAENFKKIMLENPGKSDMNTAVLGLALEFKREIIKDNKPMLYNRFIDAQKRQVKALLETGFDLDPEFFPYTLPWWFTIWCVWTDEAGELI